MRLVLAGFGTVGQGLATILRDKATMLASRYQFEPVIVGVATRSRGVLYHPDGLDADGLLRAIESGSLAQYPEQDGLIREWDTMDLIRESAANVLVEATVTNLETGQPALDYCLSALESGKDVVMANKGPAALHYEALMDAASRHGKRVRFEGTVMAGTPALSLALESLAGCTITRSHGILNGTTNYILTQMEAGRSYKDALSAAQAAGYAEADPTADVGGWDAAGKILILGAMLYQKSFRLDDLAVEGITDLTTDMIQVALRDGERYKLIASITPDGGSVKPVRLPADDPLAAVGGVTNAITFSTDLLGDVTLIGAGAGQMETGFALLADLLALHRQV